MQASPQDLAQVRLDNALALFEEFVRATARHADAAALRGLERRFAERVQIQPSYWSQIKGRSRQIGERLARQFEHLCHKPPGWMDLPHRGATGSSASSPVSNTVGLTGPAEEPARSESQPPDRRPRAVRSMVPSRWAPIAAPAAASTSASRNPLNPPATAAIANSNPAKSPGSKYVPVIAHS